MLFMAEKYDIDSSSDDSKPCSDDETTENVMFNL